MEPLQEGYYYHIYNRGAGKNRLFFSNEDFREFLRKYIFYLQPSVMTFSWCLLRNHFHFLIKTRTLEQQINFYRIKKEKFSRGLYHGKADPEVKPFKTSKQFSHFMNSYTRYINKKKDRNGTLIEGPFKRKKITDNLNFLNLICYIHRNPIHHGITKSYPEYAFSSYGDIINREKTFVESEKVIKVFGGLKKFAEAHEEFKLKDIQGLHSQR